jgi:hypothetical protein
MTRMLLGVLSFENYQVDGRSLPVALPVNKNPAATLKSLPESNLLSTETAQGDRGGAQLPPTIRRQTVSDRPGSTVATADDG